MTIQKIFDQTVNLLQSSSGGLDAAECVEEMKCSEVFFSGLRKLEKEQFSLSGGAQAAFADFQALKIPSKKIIALIESFEQLSKEGIYFVSVTTEDKTYVVFTDDGLHILHGIVTSPLNLAEKQNGVDAHSHYFLNGILQTGADI